MIDCARQRRWQHSGSLPPQGGPLSSARSRPAPHRRVVERLFELGAPRWCVVGVDDDYGRFLAAALRESAEDGAPVTEISAARRLRWTLVHRGHPS